MVLSGITLGVWQHYYATTETIVRHVVESTSVVPVEGDEYSSLFQRPDFCNETGCYTSEEVIKRGFPLTARGYDTNYRGPLPRSSGGIGVQSTLRANFFIFALGLPMAGYALLAIVAKRNNNN